MMNEIITIIRGARIWIEQRRKPTIVVDTLTILRLTLVMEFSTELHRI